MATEVRVPTLGESVTEATVGEWQKKVGEAVQADDILLELETDKVAVEVPAPCSGVLVEILVEEGNDIEAGGLLAVIDESASASASTPASASAPAKTEAAAPAPAPAPAAAPSPGAPAMPAARKIAADNNLDTAQVAGSGKGGRVTKGDVLNALSGGAAPAAKAAPHVARELGDRETRVKMTRLRKTIATRLKEAQNTAAMLTTYNEVDLTEVMAIRSKYKDLFEKKHGSRLGFMSFFVKAVCTALKEVPDVNAEIDGDTVIYKDHYDIGVAVGTEAGLVVPVVRDADQMGFAEIEATINDFGRRARDGKLKLEEMQGGTFTISNGGVYGSLMSSPILNQPQSGILGMHKIQERPMVVNGEIVVRPMMYLALSYDHRIVDGKGAVTFLVRVKENLEDPSRLLVDL